MHTSNKTVQNMHATPNSVHILLYVLLTWLCTIQSTIAKGTHHSTNVVQGNCR